MKRTIGLFLLIFIVCLALAYGVTLLHIYLHFEFIGIGIPFLSESKKPSFLQGVILTILYYVPFIIFALGTYLFYKRTKKKIYASLGRKFFAAVFLITSIFFILPLLVRIFPLLIIYYRVPKKINAAIDSINNCRVKNGLNKYTKRSLNVYEEYYCSNGVREGQFRNYDAKSRQLLKEGNYKDGKLHGLIKRYSPTFENYTYSELLYENGLLNGPFRRFNRNGQLYEEGTYRNAQYECCLEDWYEGPYKRYDPEGKGRITKEGLYKNGKFTGVLRHYEYIRGLTLLKWEILYVNGERKGEKLFYKNGIPINKEYLKDIPQEIYQKQRQDWNTIP